MITDKYTVSKLKAIEITKFKLTILCTFCICKLPRTVGTRLISSRRLSPYDSRRHWLTATECIFAFTVRCRLWSYVIDLQPRIRVDGSFTGTTLSFYILPFFQWGGSQKLINSRKLLNIKKLKSWDWVRFFLDFHLKFSCKFYSILLPYYYNTQLWNSKLWPWIS